MSLMVLRIWRELVAWELHRLVIVDLEPKDVKVMVTLLIKSEKNVKTWKKPEALMWFVCDVIQWAMQGCL